MPRAPLFLGLAALLLAPPPATARPGEPWADQGLEVTRGLLLWLDAEKLNEGRKALGLPEVTEGGRVDLWPDASGRGRHVGQRDERARPTLFEGAVRFDGESSFLERAGLGLEPAEMTVVVVGAPLSNAGNFRAFLAAHREGENDYTSGINVDLGHGFSPRFEVVNVEGPGFGGARNLLREASPFGQVRRLAVVSKAGPDGTRLLAEGRPSGARPREASTLIADRLIVGARFHGLPPRTQSSLDGDLLHVLIYDRALSDDELASVDRYLAGRIGAGEAGPLTRPLRAGVGKPLVSVANPPAVQVLSPGFSARELPVRLTNVNNLRYRPDGKLVALEYDGDVHLLSDTDGDGLEDRAEPFWENKGSIAAPIGMALTPPGYPKGDGVFVACKGKVALLLDRDRDGRADEEVVVATGWEQLKNNVDALGVAVAPGGAVYFGIGTTDFTNAYLVGPDGKAAYRLDDEHGVILRVEPDFSRRSIVATGIRFPVGLAFNRAGDLFATDQEGATWLANGNPFDELLHIQAGRHYGFPPRHPQHLPNVVDEPSDFDYGPQHQSTCGLCFNEPVNGGPTFGPARWEDNVLVAGYSRGRIYRTELVKTPHGYVARNHTFTISNMLISEVCVSPRGDLILAGHGGQPDWGSGPRGEGKLFRIAYRDHEAPQPALAWAAGPREVRIAFDRPLDPAKLADLAARVEIEQGVAVAPGDRFESLRPGYEVVGRQLAAPRFGLPIHSAGISADRRTLILTTAPHASSHPHAITLRGFGPAPTAGEIRQVPDMDLGYDLTGVEAEWKPEGEAGGEPWSGWLPHLDLGVSRTLTRGSADHDRLWESVARPGKLTLRTRLDLRRMLRPAPQPGSDPGYQLPQEHVTLHVSTNRPIQLFEQGDTTLSGAGDNPRSFSIGAEPGIDFFPLTLSIQTGGPADLGISWTTAEDDRPRPLPLRRLLLSWAPTDEGTTSLADRSLPELAGGDWARGRALFFGEPARCASCHKVRGQGGEIGPDLSNLIHRDYASVLRDIREPGAAINPDFIAYAVALADGRVLSGTVRPEGDALIVGDSDGKLTTVARSEVEEILPSTASIMPAGLDTALGPDRLRDLLTFLLTDPLGPAPLEIEGAPAPRKRSELAAVLAGSEPVANPRPLRVVLAGGPKDHGPGEHDYPLWLRRWKDLLDTDATLAIETAEGWPSAEQMAGADVVLMYSNNPSWNAERAGELDRYLARGGGLVLIHYAVEGHATPEALASRIGLAWKGGTSAFRHGPLEVDFTGSRHPITRGFSKLKLVDESYWNLVGDPSAVEILGTGVEDGQPRPLFWARQAGPGRVFVSIPGHYTWTFDDPLFRLLVLRGLAWTANQPVDRFNGLVELGARIAD